MKDIIKEFKISKATTYSGRRYNLFLFDYGYKPIISIICTFRSLIPIFTRVCKDSMQARNIQF